MLIAELGLDVERQAAAHAPAQIGEDVPIGTAFANRLDHLPDPLDSTLAVGERAVFLREAGGRKNDVGDLGCLVHENVLHHQELQVLEGLFGLV